MLGSENFDRRNIYAHTHQQETEYNSFWHKWNNGVFLTACKIEKNEEEVQFLNFSVLMEPAIILYTCIFCYQGNMILWTKSRKRRKDWMWRRKIILKLWSIASNMSSVDNIVTANTGEEQENNETNTGEVVQDAATNAVAGDPSSSSNEVPSDVVNINVSLEQIPDVTGII